MNEAEELLRGLLISNTLCATASAQGKLGAEAGRRSAEEAANAYLNGKRAAQVPREPARRRHCGKEWEPGTATFKGQPYCVDCGELIDDALAPPAPPDQARDAAGLTGAGIQTCGIDWRQHFIDWWFDEDDDSNAHLFNQLMKDDEMAQRMNAAIAAQQQNQGEG